MWKKCIFIIACLSCSLIHAGHKHKHKHKKNKKPKAQIEIQTNQIKKFWDPIEPANHVILRGRSSGMFAVFNA